jgi:hypothetical protein
MSGRIALAALVAVLAVAALPAGSVAADECNGIQRCIPVEGPWVAVPSTGEAIFMLECPQGSGTIAGTDGLASSQDIHATFDGLLGSPVAFGRTTNSTALFRAVSAHHRPGAFKPFAGCIPSPQSVHNTLAAKATPVGPPLDLRAKLFKLVPGGQRTVSVACGKGEVLVDSWSARAFTTANPPSPGLATAIGLQSRIVGRRAVLAITTSEALPASAGAEVQLGVRCAQA